MIDYTEKDLENYVEKTLLNKGYTKITNFNREYGFNMDTLIEYIKDTQREMWEKFEKVFTTQAKNKIKDCIFEKMKNKTFIEILNSKISYNGYDFNLFTSKPYNNVNNREIENFDKNIVQILRQCKYDPNNNNSLDIVLLLNGFPIITVELKNQWTKQNYENAISQYQYTRNANSPIFKFSLVHFVVDLTDVYMTTKLQGAETKFLPFNKGKGIGVDCGAGNSDDTSYLWNDALKKDNLLYLISEYICIKEQNIIFPRFHQLDCIRQIIKDILQKNKLNNYLVQHSAGSGKTNTITILSGILANLHNNDIKIFDKIILMTDRKNLDEQLTDNFKIKNISIKHADSGKELEILLKDNTKIISTTIQKFNTIREAININKKICIVVDEAHSSQSGKSAKTINKVLSESEEEQEERETYKTNLDKIIEELEKMQQPANICFIAFTATPKNKTLEKFGIKEMGDIYKPFHLYSMKQAIEENYILDVLQNYYKMDVKYNLENIEQNIKVDEKLAKREMGKFIFNDRDFIKEKCEKIIEILNDNNISYIKDKKIMVVCSSRLSAVLFYLELKDKIKSLVAFTGEIKINDKIYTEQNLNGFSGDDKITKKLKNNYDMLIVANKFQVGFDMPQLQIMFLDKKIGGVNAIQTLSRLNRNYKEKENVFIYDFVNNPKQIKKEFEKYYKETNLIGSSNFNDLYKLKDEVLKKSDWEEIEKVNNIIYNDKIDKDKKIQEITKIINLENLRNLPFEEQKSFKALLRKFNSFYVYYNGKPDNKLNIDKKLNENSGIVELHKMYNWNCSILKLFFIPDVNKDWIELLEGKVIIIGDMEKQDLKMEKDQDLKNKNINPPNPKEQIKDLLNNIVKQFNAQYGITEDNINNIMENIKDKADSQDLLNANINISKALDKIIKTQTENKLLSNDIVKDGNSGDLSKLVDMIRQNIFQYNNLNNNLRS
jgi:type I restriction enzyme R subunit